MGAVEGIGDIQTKSEDMTLESKENVEGSEDERARRALLAGVVGGDTIEDWMTIDAIPTADNNYGLPLDEADAYRQDVVTRPESVCVISLSPCLSTQLMSFVSTNQQASLADYERVPVSQFGAALLRGMGWKEGTAASRTRCGLVDPWLPTARPALLGIGAKERPAADIPGADKSGKLGKQPDRRYVPVVKIEREVCCQPWLPFASTCSLSS